MEAHHVNQQFILEALEVQSFAQIQHLLSRISSLPLDLPQLLILTNKTEHAELVSRDGATARKQDTQKEAVNLASHSGTYTHLLLIKCLTLMAKIRGTPKHVNTPIEGQRGYLYMELLAHVLYLLSLMMDDLICVKKCLSECAQLFTSMWRKIHPCNSRTQLLRGVSQKFCSHIPTVHFHLTLHGFGSGGSRHFDKRHPPFPRGFSLQVFIHLPVCTHLHTRRVRGHQLTLCQARLAVLCCTTSSRVLGTRSISSL